MIESLKRLRNLLSRRDRLGLLALFATMTVAALLEVVGVGAIPAFVSAVTNPERLMENPSVAALLRRTGLTEPEDFLVWGVLFLIALFAVKNGFLTLHYYWQMRYIANRRTDLGRRLVNAYMHAPYPFHLSRNTAALIRNVERETNIIAYQVLAASLEICTRLLILLAVLTFLFVVEPWITLCWLVIFGLAAVYGVASLGAKLKRHGLEEQRHRQRVLQALNQGFGGIKESRILQREGFFAGIVSESVRQASEALRFKQFAGAAMAPLTEFIAVTGLFVIAAALVLQGRPLDSILVTLALFVVGLVRLRETVSVGMTHFTNLRYSIVAVDPVYEDLERLERSSREAAREAERPAAPLRLQRAIDLDEVWYRYEGAERYALRGVSLQIPAGAAVGLVGGTGAGKTTLVDLVLGLLEPERGAVRVDGANIHAHNLRGWQRNVGYIPQSIYLLDDTVRRNIALGLADSEIDEAALEAAVRTAQLEGLVSQLPQGLETLVGERGARLSGGERQRIGIARALYHNPELLIMDEATSALDNTTERAIIGAVEALKGQRTIIMIAHRLSTVKNCDTLYFLKGGAVEAQGSFSDLEAISADFRLMASS